MIKTLIVNETNKKKKKNMQKIVLIQKKVKQNQKIN